jgi:hypothetical protein
MPLPTPHRTLAVQAPHTTTPAALTRKERLNRLEPTIKAPSFLHVREHRALRCPP